MPEVCLALLQGAFSYITSSSPGGRRGELFCCSHASGKEMEARELHNLFRVMHLTYIVEFIMPQGKNISETLN